MFLISVFLLLLLFAAAFLRKLNFWKQQNVEFLNVFHLVRRTKESHLYIAMQEIYHQMCLEDKPVKVIETLVTSAIILQDQEAIKDVLIRQFENFSDRGVYTNPKDPLMQNIVRFEHKEWKDMKRKLTPLFSPAKLKQMFSTISLVGDQFDQVLKDKIGNEDTVLDMHDLCSRFTVDIIGQVAFGLDCNSFKEVNTKFASLARQALGEQFRPFLDPMARKYKRILNFFNYKFHSKETTDFFTQLVAQTVAHREKHGIKRDDFLDVLIELKNDPDKNEEFATSLDAMVGQVFIFFIAGFETSCMAICEALFELARNEEVQQKARVEIKSIMAKYNDGICYESLKDMVYTKKVLLETLRKYPVLHSIPRYCCNPCKLPTANGGHINIPKDTTVIIPAIGIHYNTKFYANPNAFDPERFTEDEIAKRPSCTFLPFGDGPRRCLGESFGIMESVFCIAKLLSQFRFSVCEQTPKELEFDPKRMHELGIKDEVYLKVELI